MQNMNSFYKALIQTTSEDNGLEVNTIKISRNGVSLFPTDASYMQCLTKITQSNRVKLVSLESLLNWFMWA